MCNFFYYKDLHICLFNGEDNRSFAYNITSYNMLSFTSIGSKIDSSMKDECGSLHFILNEQNYHCKFIATIDQILNLHNYTFMIQKMRQLIKSFHI